MRLFVLVAPFWAAFVACIDSPPATDAMASARVVVQWDPLACGAPHRIAIELEDEEGRPLSSSAPCALGGLSLGVPHFGVYLGRVYAWTAEQPIRSVMPVRIDVDEPIVRWQVATPE